MAEKSDQERTEEATPKRLNEARERGQVPRSRELNSVTMLLAACVALMVLGDGIIEGLNSAMRRGLAPSMDEIFQTEALTRVFYEVLTASLWSLAPFFVLCILAALFGPLALGGWSFSASAMSFKFDKLNPLSGLKRLFGWQGISELLKALAKFTIVMIVAGFVLWNMAERLIGLATEPPNVAIAHSASLILWAMFMLSAALIVTVLADVPFQLWNHGKQLRMTKQEVRDEYKETEGKPEVKRRIRTLQMEFAKRRMMGEVPKADVIVTNPTHYAIALRYDQKRMRAPVVVAKGADLIAAEIRRVAEANNVPLLSSPALARAVFYSTELNQEIPAGLYTAVAKILAYVYQVRTRKDYQNTNLSMPDVPIPDELRRD